MGIDELIRPKRHLIAEIARRHGATNVRVFGSVARGEAGLDSDIDFLVEAGPITSQWFPGGLVADLEDLLGRRISVTTETGLSPQLRDRILREAVPVAEPRRAGSARGLIHMADDFDAIPEDFDGYT